MRPRVRGASPGLRLRSLALLGSALALVSCARVPEAGDLSGWNVVLITIDTLRADRTGFDGFNGADTPTLDSLAAEGVVFDQAMSSAPVTLPAHATLLTGRYPPAHGALDNGFYSLPENVPTIAGVLREAGYATGAVVGAYVLHSQYGLDSGFDDYNDRFRAPRQKGMEHRERPAAQVTDAALDWLEKQPGDRPFFLWAHYYDPHAPYAPPSPFKERFVTRPYDGEIAYTDREVGRLLGGIRNREGGERTLVVVTSDHGEAFGDGGELTHGLLLRESTLRIPLVMAAGPALPKGRRVEPVVSGVDVVPTILDLLGLPGPEAQGQSLLPVLADGSQDDRFVYSETRLPSNMFGWSTMHRVRGDRWAWVRAPRPELYDLEEDPGEQRSLDQSRPELARELDARVGAILDHAADTEERAALSDEELEALQALGYAFSKEVAESTGADPKDMLRTWNRLNELRDLLNAGRYREVVSGFDVLLREDPGNVEARMLRAQALVMIGRTEEGIAEFKWVLAKGVTRDRVGTILAMTLAEAGRAEEAEELLRGFAVAEPKIAEHNYNLGVLLESMERYDEAVAQYEVALRKNPEAIHVLVNLASVLSVLPEERWDVERAFGLLDRAIELSPDGDRPRLALIDVAIRFREYDVARKEIGVLSSRRLHGISRQELDAQIAKLPPE